MACSLTRMIVPATAVGQDVISSLVLQMKPA